MMYNDKLVYKVVIWVFFMISLWMKEVLTLPNTMNADQQQIVPSLCHGTPTISYLDHTYLLAISLKIGTGIKVAIQWSFAI